MRFAVSLLWGCVVGMLLVATTGMLSIQAIGLRDGAVFSMSNRLIAVQSPALPVFQYLGIVSCSILALVCIEAVPSMTRFLVRPASRIGCLIMMASLITWSLVLSHGAFVAAAERRPPHEWIEGWVQYGGVESSVHLVLVVLLLGLIMSLFRPNRRAWLPDSA